MHMRGKTPPSGDGARVRRRIKMGRNQFRILVFDIDRNIYETQMDISIRLVLVDNVEKQAEEKDR